MSYARAQMAGTAIFIIETGVEPRLLERIEATVAQHYYDQGETLCARGMLLMPRWPSEQPLSVRFLCDHKRYGFPEEVEI